MLLPTAPLNGPIVSPPASSVLIFACPLHRFTTLDSSVSMREISIFSAGGCGSLARVRKEANAMGELLQDLGPLAPVP